MNLNKEITFRNRKYNVLDILAGIAIIAVGIAIRISLFEYESGDWTVFLKPWTDLLKKDGFGALKIAYYNYTPMYMYILYGISILPIDTLIGIKVVSCIFDFCLACGVSAVVGEIKPSINRLIPFAVVWFCPTVISNSAMWGQCDAIYTFFVVMCLLYLLRGKSFIGLLFYGIAFAIKLQSIFFAPILLLLFFLKKIRFRDFFSVPIIYFISIIPVWIAGRSLKSLLLIYYEQSGGKNNSLSSNYPNIYYLIGNDVYVELFGGTAILFTIASLLVIMYYVLRKCYAIGITNELLIQVALISGSIIVFLLPSMRERYSYLIDIIAICYAFTCARKWHVPVTRIMISYLAYTTYYRYGMYMRYEILAVLQIWLILDGINTLFKCGVSPEMQS